MIPDFQAIYAVDWSGARGPRLPGLQVALGRPGRAPPRLIYPARRFSWTRQEVLDFLLNEALKHPPVLAGIDAAMAFPFTDAGAYFPGHPATPRTAASLWRMVDDMAEGARDFYAGAFGRTGQRFSEYLNSPGYRGDRFDNQRGRQTELACRARWTRPSSVFNCVGAGSVGMGSLAAMRLARAFKKIRAPNVALWPFDDVAGADLVVVEIFPRLYVKQAGMNPQQWRERDFLSGVFTQYQTHAPRQAVHTEDEADALLSAAAMRVLAKRPETWCPRGMSNIAARTEGWIFGVV